MKDDTPDNNIHPEIISLRNTVITHLIIIKTLIWFYQREFFFNFKNFVFSTIEYLIRGFYY